MKIAFDIRVIIILIALSIVVCAAYFPDYILELVDSLIPGSYAAPPTYP